MHSMTLKPLRKEDIDEIFKKYVKTHTKIACDEYHAHSFDCAVFDSEEIMILERLRVEVIILQDKLEQINKLTSR
jgi:hypothetical protein